MPRNLLVYTECVHVQTLALIPAFLQGQETPLGAPASTAGGPGLIPVRGPEASHGMGCSQKLKKKTMGPTETRAEASSERPRRLTGAQTDPQEDGGGWLLTLGRPGCDVGLQLRPVGDGPCLHAEEVGDSLGEVPHLQPARPAPLHIHSHHFADPCGRRNGERGRFRGALSPACLPGSDINGGGLSVC